MESKENKMMIETKFLDESDTGGSDRFSNIVGEEFEGGKAAKGEICWELLF